LLQKIPPKLEMTMDVYKIMHCHQILRISQKYNALILFFLQISQAASAGDNLNVCVAGTSLSKKSQSNFFIG
jgi:hypothetical protein